MHAGLLGSIVLNTRGKRVGGESRCGRGLTSPTALHPRISLPNRRALQSTSNTSSAGSLELDAVHEHVPYPVPSIQGKRDALTGLLSAFRSVCQLLRVAIGSRRPYSQKYTPRGPGSHKSSTAVGHPCRGIATHGHVSDCLFCRQYSWAWC